MTKSTPPATNKPVTDRTPTIRQLAERFASECALAGQTDYFIKFGQAVAARERERCAPYMQHKHTCALANMHPKVAAHLPKKCTCGLAAIRASAGQEE